MYGKLVTFSFVAALVVFIAKALISKADVNGNIYIETPVGFLKKTKNNFVKSKTIIKKAFKEKF